MTKPADKARLRTAVNRINLKNLVKYLETLGADASNILRTREERMQRMRSEPIGVSPAMLDNVVAVLRVKAKVGRTSIWSREIEAEALIGLFNNKPIRALARQIAAKTGQSKDSVRTQLQNLKKLQKVHPENTPRIHAVPKPAARKRAKK
jgi:hypothetical protein